MARIDKMTHKIIIWSYTHQSNLTYIRLGSQFHICQSLLAFLQAKHLRLGQWWPIEYTLFDMHRRAQTASLHRTPLNPHAYATKAKHQDTLLKQIKALHILSTQPPTTSHPSRHHRQNSPLHSQLRQIEKLRGKTKPPFSLEKDQRKICQAGWDEFLEGHLHKDVKKVRNKLRKMRRERATVGSIFIREGMAPEHCKDAQIGQEKLGELWKWAKGTQLREDNYFRMCDLNKEIKDSVVLRNAYNVCLNSMSYQKASEEAFRGQKLKSYVYLKENQHRLPQKQLNQLYRNNSLLP